MDRKYFFDRLAAGESVDEIAADISALLNEASADYNAHEAELAAQAELEIKAEKIELVGEMMDILKEFAILEGLTTDFLDATPEEVEYIANNLTTIFTQLKTFEKMCKQVASPAKSKSNNSFLDEFVKILG